MPPALPLTRTPDVREAGERVGSNRRGNGCDGLEDGEEGERGKRGGKRQGRKLGLPNGNENASGVDGALSATEQRNWTGPEINKKEGAKNTTLRKPGHVCATCTTTVFFFFCFHFSPP